MWREYVYVHAYCIQQGGGVGLAEKIAFKGRLE